MQYLYFVTVCCLGNLKPIGYRKLLDIFHLIVNVTHAIFRNCPQLPATARNKVRISLSSIFCFCFVRFPAASTSAVTGPY
jgi:hypothetical protein